MKTPVGSEPELLSLRKLAEDLAKNRREKPTTAHLLAAIASRGGDAASLLDDRSLTAESLLRGARTAGEDTMGTFPRAVQRARDLARRMRAAEPTAAHLLVALLSEPNCAARRTLDQHGVDIGRLRSAGMNLGMGWYTRHRPDAAVFEAKAPARSAEVGGTKKATARPPTGVTIPLFPPSPRVAVGKRSTPPAVTEAPGSVIPTNTGAGGEESSRLGREAIPSKRRAPAASGSARRRSVTESEDRYRLDPRRFPTLTALGVNLTQAALEGQLEPVVGRQAEVEQALDILAKRQGNNPCLVGASGVGKTSVVRGMALRIAERDRVATLDDRIIIEIPVTELIAGTGVRGALAERVAALHKEVLAASGRVVLFFDEVHQLFGGDGSEELGAELKLAMARGELPCIGATTPEEFRARIAGDPALARRFSVVEIPEPSREDAFLISEAVARRLELYHGVSYEEEAVALAVGWTVRYLPGQALPDKAISVLDLAGARSRRRAVHTVDARAVAEVVAERADMPVERLLETDTERLLELEQTLAERIVGHESQVGKIARILRRSAAGLGGGRPLGTFLLLGTTGVGKTETAKAIAEVLFHSESAMSRIDLSEYSEAHSVARLIGAPPGYVGHDAGGQLTEAVRRRPYQVVLLDEVEKAHTDVLMTFLPLFDEGRLTDGKGRTVDFTNTVIVMTSNIGSELVSRAAKRRVGFGGGVAVDASDLDKRVTDAARATLAPELYNRIDEVLVFPPLSRDDVCEVARRLVAKLGTVLMEQRGIGLDVEDSALDFILDAGGFDPTLGARPIKRALARHIEAPLADKILRGELQRGDVALISVEDGVLGIDAVAARV